jgi:hypothetical protein
MSTAASALIDGGRGKEPTTGVCFFYQKPKAFSENFQQPQVYTSLTRLCHIPTSQLQGDWKSMSGHLPTSAEESSQGRGNWDELCTG